MKKIILLVLLIGGLTIFGVSQFTRERFFISNTTEDKNFNVSYYCNIGKTSSGQFTRQGLIAADTRYNKIGTKFLIDGKTYTVADTGGMIKGPNRFDIWLSSCKSAKIKGRQILKGRRL